MSTTSMFIELLIIGFETVIWLVLLTGTLFGVDWIRGLVNFFGRAELLLIASLIGVAYLAGIIVDGIADALTEVFEVRILQPVLDEEGAEKWELYARAVSADESANSILQYTRSRVRILRSSILNFLLITVFALTLINTRLALSPGTKLRISLFVGIGGLIATGLVVFGFFHLQKCYWDMVRSFYRARNEPSGPKT